MISSGFDRFNRGNDHLPVAISKQRGGSLDGPDAGMGPLSLAALAIRPEPPTERGRVLRPPRSCEAAWPQYRLRSVVEVAPPRRAGSFHPAMLKRVTAGAPGPGRTASWN